MKAVAAIMTKKVVTVAPETSVAEIARLLLESKVSALPVTDDDHRVVGIVSEGDLLGRPPADSPRGWWLKLLRALPAWRRSPPPVICRRATS